MLERSWHEVAPISRAAGVDVITGAGLEQALDAVSAILDVATGPSWGRALRRPQVSW